MATVCVDPDDFTTDANGRLQIKAGNCGIEKSPDGLVANVSTWPYACDLEARAGRVYCDEDGVLRTDPRPRSARILVSTANNADTPVNPVSSIRHDSAVPLDLTSWCEPAIVHVTVSGQFQLNLDENDSWAVDLLRSVDGGTDTVLIDDGISENASRNVTIGQTLTIGDAFTLAPGALYSLSWGVRIRNNNPIFGEAINVLNRRVRVAGIAVSSNP